MGQGKGVVAMVPEYTNIFHSLHTKMGIKEFEKHLVLKYIQKDMEFLDISSLISTYRYVVKIEKKFKKNNK
jgi:hypothetical protein